MRQDREELLRRLTAVSPGLATKEAVEQSSCFIFRGGRVTTFNDEVSCSMECDIGITGAVAAKPLMDLLGKLAEIEVEVCTEEGVAELLVKGKRRRAGITMESEITLPVDSIAPPKKWGPLPPDFAEAVGLVQECASTDKNNFHLTCIHLTDGYIEACDNFQLARYAIATGVADCLVKCASLKGIVGLGMTEVGETKTWLHFRNPSGLVFSVRREVLDYENLEKILKVENATPTTLPGGLAEAVEKAEIFSSENAENNVIIVQLTPGRLCIRGVGASGWYEERKDVKWDGEPIAFSISPKLLKDIADRTTDCHIAPGRLKIESGKFAYVTCLGKVGV